MTVVNNGLEAFEAIKKKRYDVILMDVQMPIMVSLSFLFIAYSYSSTNIGWV